jgi:hypothetical protein
MHDKFTLIYGEAHTPGRCSEPPQFFYTNYSNNPNFNNKSDKIKILKIQMIVRHRQ